MIRYSLLLLLKQNGLPISCFETLGNIEYLLLTKSQRSNRAGQSAQQGRSDAEVLSVCQVYQQQVLGQEVCCVRRETERDNFASQVKAQFRDFTISLLISKVVGMSFCTQCIKGHEGQGTMPLQIAIFAFILYHYCIIRHGRVHFRCIMCMKVKELCPCRLQYLGSYYASIVSYIMAEFIYEDHYTP